ncbi:CpaD family pilus assembly lipoprotein [Nitratireductor sp. GZWM139]|uniref:CpaD family pilus assembly protein n=1 Tax=Nitratireductor sp. GZWM139 TaxID=2950541 RepID=UPI0024BEEEAF|nr:CpaD family pilus assembly lipoprotein [Nitratireductor sp. GZWM139]MDJ1463671.1 CpaD family pilus assembly lipoprotein [Nitratireductor sp. GZWM139]
MSGVVMMKHETGNTARLKTTGAVLLIGAAALLAGCAAKRDSVIVGSIPDDYRTNHPTVISEKDQKIDLPVAISAKSMTRGQAGTLAGFMSGYDRRSGGTVTVLVPTGSVNERGASNIASQITRQLQKHGVPPENIAVVSYRAPSADTAPPIRVSYPAIRASTNQCGRWPEDILDTTDNKHYANFGCSYQNNLAAQVANPNDFLGPRQQTPIDAENRMGVIDKYRGSESSYEAGKVSKEFRGNREVQY